MPDPAPASPTGAAQPHPSPRAPAQRPPFDLPPWAPPPALPAPALPLAGRPRRFLRGLLLIVATLSIYMYYWHYKVHDELRLQYERDQQFPTLLFVLCLIPFVNLVAQPLYMAKLLELKERARAVVGLPAGMRLGTFLLWYVVGVLIIVGPFVAYWKLQTEVNEVWASASAQQLRAWPGQPPMYVPPPA